MTSNWTFGRKLGLGFAMAAAILLIVAGFGYRTTQSLIENDRWVSHTQQVRRELAQLLALATDAETSQRGYLLTGERDFTVTFEASAQRLVPVFDGLRKLTADNPKQQSRLDAMKPVLDSRMTTMKRVIARRDADGLEVAAKLIAGGEGTRQMEDLRRIGAEMDGEEAALLAKREHEAEASAALTKAVMVWGSVLGIVLVALVGLFISRSLSTPDRRRGRGTFKARAAELQAAANQQATGAQASRPRR